MESNQRPRRKCIRPKHRRESKRRLKDVSSTIANGALCCRIVNKFELESIKIILLVCSNSALTIANSTSNSPRTISDNCVGQRTTPDMLSSQNRPERSLSSHQIFMNTMSMTPHFHYLFHTHSSTTVSNSFRIIFDLAINNFPISLFCSPPSPYK